MMGYRHQNGHQEGLLRRFSAEQEDISRDCIKGVFLCLSFNLLFLTFVDPDMDIFFLLKC